mmetsp:Transcript_9953/g.23005  ORF Transcript_9953/g.23005 Transcript_9953/m.23005 type:complete len:253 (-) Transcript_9953:117-875(-)
MRLWLHRRPNRLWLQAVSTCGLTASTGAPSMNSSSGTVPLMVFAAYLESADTRCPWMEKPSFRPLKQLLGRRKRRCSEVPHVTVKVPVPNQRPNLPCKDRLGVSAALRALVANAGAIVTVMPNAQAIWFATSGLEPSLCQDAVEQELVATTTAPVLRSLFFSHHQDKANKKPMKKNQQKRKEVFLLPRISFRDSLLHSPNLTSISVSRITYSTTWPFQVPIPAENSQSPVWYCWGPSWGLEYIYSCLLAKPK